ncbi:putative helicase mov-10-B.2 [Brachyistius frenatus]|uniref:putative helicase mov-10-B.2 n=1 Tax=Brachyistius frenatus TaxID=100188 RepID=UPI0037E91474
MVEKESLHTRCQLGLEFFDFLRDTKRASSTYTIQSITDIYISEFRTRNDGTRYPSFSSVLYALQYFNKITRRRNTIRINSAVSSVPLDQWRTHRTRQPQPVQNTAATPVAAQDFNCSADEEEMDNKNLRKLAGRLIEKLKTDRSQLISDQCGIRITSDYPFEDGKLVWDLCGEDTDQLFQRHVLKLKVKNIGAELVHFTEYTPLQTRGPFTLSDKHKLTKSKPLSLKPGDSYEIQVHFLCGEVGVYIETLAFAFKPVQQPAFYIVRFIEAQVQTSLGRELRSVAPYKPRSLRARNVESHYKIIDWQRPKRQLIMMQQTVWLKEYKIPADMNQFIKSLKQPPLHNDKRRAMLESPLSWENYTEKLHLLLYLEELQMHVDIRRYNIPNDEADYAVMRTDPVNKKLHVLELPGLSENRPSLIRGDNLIVYPVGVRGVKYHGCVHSVQRDSVKLNFISKFQCPEGTHFHVEFSFNRLNLKLKHRAADQATQHNLEKVLFPDADPSSYQKTGLPNLSLFNPQLETNREQYQAVRHIVAGTSRPAPYLVFGPPGTGKTMTLVEAITQIEKSQTSCHILACAHTNSATDLLCSKILENVDKHKVYRMYAKCSDPKLVPEQLTAHSNLEEEEFIFPSRETLMQYKIMVTTLFTAGRLITKNIHPGYYTHVFVDEAGHPEETECLIPLAGLLDAKSGQVVLAGDPKQLGPIVRSPFAIKYGMGVSLLERLMKDCSPYQKKDGVYNNCFVTKLRRNYRSHPDILKIPNELFYDGELQVCANEDSRNCYCKWEGLKKEGFPVIFHDVTGVAQREGSSPSFFNIAEVEVLIKYVEDLLQTKGQRGQPTVAARDIGIIAPYKKQVAKIRKFLEKVGKDLKIKDMDDLKVGSVEEFQGQERTVIIVSTVRSSPNFLELDKKFELGFVRDDKRINVAMTRAKALLIVVGNRRVLNTVPTWARFIRHCSDKRDSVLINYLHEEEEEEKEFVSRLAHLFIQIVASVETAESTIQ